MPGNAHTLIGNQRLNNLRVLAEHVARKGVPGGFAIVDDYGDVEACRAAVTDFRSSENIDETIHDIDGTGVFWQKDA